MILAAPSAMRVWVVYQCRRSYDFDLWYWNDELGTAFAQALLFLENERAVIPRKQEDVVGRLGRKDFGREDRNVAPRSQQPDFLRCRIGNILQVIGRKAAKIQERPAFRRCTVCGDGFPLGAETSHERHKSVANRIYFPLEPAESLERVKSGLLFELQKSCDALAQWFA